MSSSVIVDISISADEYLKWYGGSAKDVFTYSRDGRSVRFPAKILQRYVGRDGIRGSFLITFDHEQRFQKIERL